ncbi:HAMP domain-containing protein [Massilia sp. RP-1-19]|uniref:HAMP domain-containing protein n=1 Tax=Massilia polaris TaxID=2728846 RepID=A0A848HLE0_9BURK|nr:methyl-accepting chemotaxis protein [Massilia polaris]NML62175.1 HAMP domain-containing protein [Massilia polaris]
MLQNLSIKQKLYAGFGAIVAILLILLVLAYNNFSKVSEATRLDRHTLEVMLETDQIGANVLDIQNQVRGYLLTGEERFLTPEVDEEALVQMNINHAVSLTADSPAQHERLRKVDAAIDSWLQNVNHPLIDKRRALGQAPGAAEQAARAPELATGFATVAEIRKMLGEIAAEENRLLAQRSAEAAELQKSMSMVLVAGGAICIVLASIIAMMLGRALLTPINNLTEVVGRIARGDQSARARVLARDELGNVTAEFNRMAQAIEDGQAKELAVAKELRAKVDALLDVVSKAASGDLTGSVTVSGDDAAGRMGDGLKTMVENLRKLINNVQKAGIQVTTSATEIAASAKQQEATGVEQAQTSVEILATTKEMSANTSQLLRTMEEATEVADYTTSATADAQNNLRRMDQTMQNMVAATDSINAKLAALSEKASNINSVLTTITKVADQTNILSLNAAIEAEKAGEAGRGFSVVATEIRRLADQTSVSTWDIEQMLKEMQSAVSASVMGMDKFSEEIRRSVGEVSQVGLQLSSVMDQVQKLAPQFDLVLQGMQSQAVGASQISETMMQLSDATQQTVESLKATSEAVHQLQYAASDLQSSVSTFAVNH